MSLKSMTKAELIDRVKELENEVIDLEANVDNQFECDCGYENDMEITDLQNDKEELENRIEELEKEIDELTDKVNQLEESQIDVSELECVETDLEDAIHKLSCIRERAE